MYIFSVNIILNSNNDIGTKVYNLNPSEHAIGMNFADTLYARVDTTDIEIITNDSIGSKSCNYANNAGNALNLGNVPPHYFLRADGSNGSINAVGDLNIFYNSVGLFTGQANLPGEGWWLVVAGGTGGTQVQLVYALYDPSIVFTRVCAANNWTGWTKRKMVDFGLSGSTLYLSGV